VVAGRSRCSCWFCWLTAIWYWGTPSARTPTGCATAGSGRASTNGSRPQSTALSEQALVAPWNTPPAASQVARSTVSEQDSSWLQQAPTGCGQGLGLQVLVLVSGVPPCPVQEVWSVTVQLPLAKQQAKTSPVGVKSIVSCGGVLPSRDQKRRVVELRASSPTITHPKLPAGLSSQFCTSAAMAALLHTPCPPLPVPTLALALTAPKSAPGLVQLTCWNWACSQVASPVLAGAPWPPPRMAPQSTVPSPHRRVTGRSVMVAFWLSPERLMVVVRVTLLMVEPAGTAPATSNCSSARRLKPSAVFPA